MLPADQDAGAFLRGSDIEHKQRLCNQSPNFALNRKLKAIGFFGQIDLHGNVRHIDLMLLNAVIAYAPEPLQHGLEMPNRGTALVDGSREARGMCQHELSHVLT